MLDSHSIIYMGHPGLSSEVQKQSGVFSETHQDVRLSIEIPSVKHGLLIYAKYIH